MDYFRPITDHGIRPDGLQTAAGWIADYGPITAGWIADHGRITAGWIADYGRMDFTDYGRMEYGGLPD